MTPLEFMHTIFGEQTGYLFACRRGAWEGERFHYPDEVSKALPYDYFCVQLLKTPGARLKENIVDKVSVVWADLDTCKPSKLLVSPSILVQSSPGRYQGYWLLDAPVPSTQAEELSRRIAYHHAKDGADRSGWDLTQLLRIPGTRNSKYENVFVKLISQTSALYRPSDFEGYPAAPVVRHDNVELPEGKALPLHIPYYQSFYEEICQEPVGPDRSGRTNWLFKRNAEICLEKGVPPEDVPGIARTLMHDFKPAVDKFRGKRLEQDLVRWIAKDWPKMLTNMPATHGALARRYVLTKASTIKPRRVKWGWDKRVPVGEFCLIPGREGIGKSLFLSWMAAELTLGTLPGEFLGQPKAVIIATSEDSWTYTIVPRLMVAGANLDMVHRVETEEHGRLILPVDTHLIPEMAREVDAAALMLDPIVSLIADDINVNKSAELRKALEPLRNAAEIGNIMVLALAHFNKAADQDIMSKISGARAWAEVCRAAVALAHDKDADQYVLSQAKNNLGRMDLPHLTYEIEEAFVETEDGTASVGRLVWTGETDVGAEEVMARKPDRSQEKNLANATTSYRITQYVVNVGKLVTAAEIMKAMPDLKLNTIQKTLKRAAEAGTLSNPSRGLYGPADTDGLSP